ncbi:MAG: HAD hydrolase-like protein [Paracoccaceae bacterium]|nr:HAD hydrolase-like protein [Paracoccaceae bacterium]
MLTTPEIFKRYEEIRSRMPQAQILKNMRDISDLTEIVKNAEAFIFDAFGVLNIGNTLITGADLRLRELRALGCEVRILTNAASYERSGAVTKFSKLGIEIKESEIITSRDAAIQTLTLGLWGVIASNEDYLKDIYVNYLRLGKNPYDYDRVDGFLFLSSSNWSESKQQLLKDSLLKNDRPVVIANPDLVAPRDNGFSIEPGHFGHLLVDTGVTNVRFFGKPFPEVYNLVEASLPGIPNNKIVMCGDTLHTDILGAATRGWQTVLVTQDGLFSGYDTKKYCSDSGIYPNWRLPRI